MAKRKRPAPRNKPKDRRKRLPPAPRFSPEEGTQILRAYLRNPPEFTHPDPEELPDRG
jgi:hypothetical protein